MILATTWDGCAVGGATGSSSSHVLSALVYVLRYCVLVNRFKDHWEGIHTSIPGGGGGGEVGEEVRVGWGVWSGGEFSGRLHTFYGLSRGGERKAK